jgi:hypothetical protein
MVKRQHRGERREERGESRKKRAEIREQRAESREPKHEDALLSNVHTRAVFIELLAPFIEHIVH